MRCVPAHDFTLAKALAWRSAIADDPPYQRPSAVWSLAKQQLFIDSLINGYDVPKIYLHDLRGKHPTRVYAVVDGKQRLTTIWDFLTDRFPLADDFRTELANLPELPDGAVHPAAGQRFSQLDPEWQRVLRRTYLAIVLIQNATEADIEDLFSRLNNGEPLTPAEKRNAFGGDAARLVRATAAHRFFRDRVSLGNGRYQHLDVATRLVMLEDALLSERHLPDLGMRGLDTFVQAHRRMHPTHRHRVRAGVGQVLDRLAEAFESRDRLLATHAMIPVVYLVARSVRATAPEGWAAAFRSGVATFETDGRVRRASTGGRSVAQRARTLAAWLRASSSLLADAIPPDAGLADPGDGVLEATRVHSIA